MRKMKETRMEMMGKKENGKRGEGMRGADLQHEV